MCWPKGKPRSAETRAKLSAANRTHGHTTNATKSPTYATWHAMLTRCLYPGTNGYARYGAKGITACDRWNPRRGGTFANFLADLGPRPAGMSIDRINNDGNYEPGNCRWATPKEQARNKRKRVAKKVEGKAA